jgi:hypothetical protein
LDGLSKDGEEVISEKDDDEYGDEYDDEEDDGELIDEDKLSPELKAQLDE